METTDILDIHTHRPMYQHYGIVNYSPWEIPQTFCLPEKVDVEKTPWSSISAMINSFLPECSFDQAFHLQEGCFYSDGVHPWELTERNANQQLTILRRLLERKRLVAVGEAGLDKLAPAPMELQLKVFREQVSLSEQYELPLIVHCVKAMEELLAVQKEYCPRQPWIWHGFRGKPIQAVQLLKKGFYLSFGRDYDEDTMRIVPGSRLFLETDNEGMAQIGEFLHRAAYVREEDVEALRKTIKENIQKVFFKG